MVDIRRFLIEVRQKEFFVVTSCSKVGKKSEETEFFEKIERKIPNGEDCERHLFLKKTEVYLLSQRVREMGFKLGCNNKKMAFFCESIFVETSRINFRFFFRTSDKTESMQEV
ncbi:hypothetical protein NPIL_350061 [Nephila pilipes]|uniref:Uncharacterized protein n=1 Tax=Nephila pilipes TaxID=299642 RepID=A0A8X6QU69_NEPPI|nr:hypothetical protein NPIL_350061 [Nephila pilipes]